MVRAANRTTAVFHWIIRSEGIEEFRNPDGSSAKFHKKAPVR